MSARSYLSIGDVLSLLREEFPDVTISKIRFLESQGLVNPERSVSGYRKFYDNDVKRLRWVLRQQREHFLPLKVIRDRLDTAIDSGQGVKSKSDLKKIDAQLDDKIIEQASGIETDKVQTDSNNFNESQIDQVLSTAAFRQTRAVAKVSRIPALMTASAVSVTSATDGVSRFRDEPESSNDLSFAASVEPSYRAALRDLDGLTEAIQSGKDSDPEPDFDPGLRDDAQSVSEDVRGVTLRTEPEIRIDRPEVSGISEVSGVSMTLDELCLATGLQSSDIDTIESFGLINPTVIAGTVYYDESALLIASLVADFSNYGIEPRHLRLYKNAADRELGLIEQVVSPLLRQRNPKARQRANESSDELAELGQRLRASLISRGLRDQLGR